MSNLKLFGRWDTSNIPIKDPGLQRYITLDNKYLPISMGRNTHQFWKTRYNIVERLINKVMVPGHKGKKHFLTSGRSTGKKVKASKIVFDALDKIEKKLNKNPVEVLVGAIQNAAPREEITTIEYGGARYPQAVDCSPVRRVDIVLRQMVHGAYHKSFNKKTKMSDALADEISKAYNSDNSSAAISKKIELERQAEASR